MDYRFVVEKEKDNCKFLQELKIILTRVSVFNIINNSDIRVNYILLVLKFFPGGSYA